MIYTLNTKDYLLYAVAKSTVEMPDNDVYEMINSEFSVMVSRLKKKGITYNQLKRALIPNQDKDNNEVCLVFDSSLIDSSNYGYDVFNKLLPLLDKNSTYSILAGDYIDIIRGFNNSQEHLFEVFKKSIEFIRKIVFDDNLISLICETAMEVQNRENTTLPLLKKQYGDTLKSIDNLLNAMQQGILTPSTKERMESLEKQKTELSIQIVKEEMMKPTISAEEIEAYFDQLRMLNFKRHDHRRRLIDAFINKIVLFDDGRIFFGCNFKECSKEMTITELEEAGILGSDISALTAPKK